MSHTLKQIILTHKKRLMINIKTQIIKLQNKKKTLTKFEYRNLAWILLEHE